VLTEKNQNKQEKIRQNKKETTQQTTIFY